MQLKIKQQKERKKDEKETSSSSSNGHYFRSNGLFGKYPDSRNHRPGHGGSGDHSVRGDYGGYTIEASKTDKRISAVATISMFNTGRVRRNGMSDGDMEGIPGRLEQAAAAREQYVATGEVEYIGGLNTQRVEFTQEELEQLPAGLYRDGTEYYGSTHFHPYSQSRYTAMSLMDLMPFDVENHAELIDQPLLMIAGDISDTRYMTEGVFEKATGTDDKELFLIEGAQHIETYWQEDYVSQELNKLVEFFGDKLA